LWSIDAAATFATHYLGDHPAGEFRNGAIRLTNGSFAAVRSLNTGWHLLINGLSTVLLAGSNYYTQCACGPTGENPRHADRTNHMFAEAERRDTTFAMSCVSSKTEVLFVGSSSLVKLQ
jgi:hypothetical protein